MKEIHATGLWHLPESPDNPVAGKLNYSVKRGARLQLVGTLGNPTAFMEAREYPLIHGILNKSPYGRHITLVDSFQRSRSFGMPGFTTEELRTHLVIAGDMLLTSEQMAFDSFRVQFSEALNWLSPRPLQTNNPAQPERGFDIRFRFPPPTILSAIGKTIEIHIGYSTKFAMHGSLNVAPSATILMKGLELGGIKDLTKHYIRPLQNLLTFASDIPNGVLELAVSRQDLIDPFTQQPQLFHILYDPVFKNFKSHESRSPHEMLFTWDDIKADETFLDRWLVFSYRKSEFCNIYFSSLEAPAKYGETKFMLILQSMQFLLVDPSEAENKVQREKLTAAFSSAVPTDDVRFIDWAAPTRADIIFPRLFHNSLKHHFESMPSMFPGGIETFFKKVQEIRNSIQQPRADQQSPPYSGEELFWLNERLRFLIRAEILAQVGFDAGRIKSLLERNRLYLHLSAQASRPAP